MRFESQGSGETKKFSLVIDNCNAANDSGEYAATLSDGMNEKAVVKSRTCRMNITTVPPKRGIGGEKDEGKERMAPVFVETLKDLTVAEGRDVCFKCTALGAPTPKLGWFKDGKPLVESNKIKVSETSLMRGC